MSGQLPNMLPAYGGQRSDCISPLREHSRGGRPDPLQHAFRDDPARESAKKHLEDAFSRTRVIPNPNSCRGGCRWGSPGHSARGGPAPTGRQPQNADPPSCAQGTPTGTLPTNQPESYRASASIATASLSGVTIGVMIGSVMPPSTKAPRRSFI